MPRSATSPAPVRCRWAPSYAHQRRLAEELGADRGGGARRNWPGPCVAARDRCASRAQLTGGADVVIDCVGRRESLAQALAMVRPRGRVVLVGMPGKVSRRPGLAVAPRGRPSPAPTPTGPRTSTGSSGAPSTSPWRWCAPGGSGAWCRPATRSSASKRRWPTRRGAGAAARSRSSSTCATPRRAGHQRRRQHERTAA